MGDDPREQVQPPAGEASAPKWGDPISEERQAELQRRVDAWAAEQDQGGRTGPFDIRPALELERQQRFEALVARVNHGERKKPLNRNSGGAENTTNGRRCELARRPSAGWRRF